jgi:hypothetical protein
VVGAYIDIVLSQVHNLVEGGLNKAFSRST